MPPIAATTLSLQRIEALPLDTSGSLFSHYAAMKLGLGEAVAFYARKLADRVLQLVQATPECKAWVLTAPPYNAIPAAANLLAWQVQHLLRAELPATHELSLVDLRLPKHVLRIDSEADFRRYYQYSSNTLEERVRERERLHTGPDAIVQHERDFQDKGVIVINDIKVTGTQQKFMQASFERVQPRSLHWLYILEVAQALAESCPQIEHEINQSSIKSPEEFGAALRSGDIRYTARCVARLFSQEPELFRSLLASLDSDRKQRLLELAEAEGRYDNELFREKLTLLRNGCVDHA